MAEKYEMTANQFQGQTAWLAVISVFHGRPRSTGTGDGPSPEVAVLVLGSHGGILEGRQDRLPSSPTGGDLFDRDPHPSSPAVPGTEVRLRGPRRGLACGRQPAWVDLAEEAAEEDQAAESAPADAEDTAVQLELEMATAALGANQRAAELQASEAFADHGRVQRPGARNFDLAARAKGICSRWW